MNHGRITEQTRRTKKKIVWELEKEMRTRRGSWRHRKDEEVKEQ